MDSGIGYKQKGKIGRIVKEGYHYLLVPSHSSTAGTFVDQDYFVLLGMDSVYRVTAGKIYGMYIPYDILIDRDMLNRQVSAGYDLSAALNRVGLAIEKEK